MAKYRKKPVVIEAVEWTGKNVDEMYRFMQPSLRELNVQWMEPVKIMTLEGVMEGNIGDFIIKGVQGEFYPCKPDIFEQTYEKVEAEQSIK